MVQRPPAGLGGRYGSLDGALRACARLADPWVLASLTVYAVLSVTLVHRTGGLEAACVVHTINNVSFMVYGLVLGGFEESFIDADATMTPWALLRSAALMGGALAVVWWRASRCGLARWSSPEITSGAAG